MCLHVIYVSECTCGCACTHMSSMRCYFWEGAWVSWWITSKGYEMSLIIDPWYWRHLPGCPTSQTWQMFAIDIFNRAQRDFYLEFSPCVQQRKLPLVCVYIYKHLRVKERALIFKWSYSPIAGQDLAPYGGLMQIWDRCLIAWTMESWLKQFLNMLSVEYPVLGQWVLAYSMKKMYFSSFGNYWGANNHEKVHAHRHTELLLLLYFFKIQTRWDHSSLDDGLS